MIKPTITLLAGLMMTGAAISQTRLQGGAPAVARVVTQPYFYYDLMRDQHVEWIREYRPTASQAWNNSNLLINRKGADGRFIHLEYALWNFSIDNWEVLNKYIYQREYTDGNITRQEMEVTLRNESGAVNNYTVDENYFYENGRLKNAQSAYLYASGQAYELSSFFMYNNEGHRIHDSDLINQGGLNFSTRYEYNGPGNKCSRQSTEFGSMGITDHIEYGYDNTAAHNLTYYALFNHINDTTILNYKEEYEYNEQNQITKATITIADSTGNPASSYYYDHGYTGNRLQWMTFSSFEDNRLLKQDSVYITFNNGNADTSYGFTSANGTDWNSFPSFRFLFNFTPVGVTKALKTQIDFGLFPNPASRHLTVSLEDNKPAKQVLITDLLGKTSASFTDVVNGQPLNISALKAGIYIVRVETGNGTGTKKLVVE